jgi:hypothetical protein
VSEGVEGGREGGRERGREGGREGGGERMMMMMGTFEQGDALD